MKKTKISHIVLLWLLVCVVAAFATTALVSYITNTQMSERNTTHLLQNSIEDVLNELKDGESGSLTETCKSLEDPDIWPIIDTQFLQEISAGRYNEINISDSTGCVTVSSDPARIGFNYKSTPQSATFLRLLDTNNPPFYIQEHIIKGADSPQLVSIARRFSEHKGFVHLVIDINDYYDDIITTFFTNSTRHRRVGDAGEIYVVDKNGGIMSAPASFTGDSINQTGLTVEQLASIKPYELMETIVAGEEVYCMHYNYKNLCDIIAILPVKEATYARNTAFRVSTLSVLVIFILLFITVYLLMRRQVVRSIVMVNNSLAHITEGNLNETVNVRNSQEFESLSDGINQTVNRLKDYIHEAETRLDADLLLAKSIQMASLPNVFPAFPGRNDFQLYASTEPAKEVGGDFYDFFLLGNDKLVISIADVSGKGIPAAMFMMRGKAAIKNLATSGLAINEVFDRANTNLCQSNDTNTFITEWLAVIDLTTGLVQYINAGHNAPLIRCNGERYEYLADKQPNLPLGAFDGLPYTVKTMQLQPGDTLFLYTDGVSEAENPDAEIYGDDRLLDAINTLPADALANPEATCNAISESLKEFVAGAEQSDDITMLCFKWCP